MTTVKSITQDYIRKKNISNDNNHVNDNTTINDSKDVIEINDINGH